MIEQQFCDDFGDSIKNAEQALSYCLCNKFTHADNFLKELDQNCMYHVMSRATISYIQAMLTYERQLIDIAYEKLKNASHICDSFRKKHSLGEIVNNWIGRTNFGEFSEIELHAELCFAECLLQRAMLTFIQDENLISFIKGGLKIRSAYNIYRNCMHALEQNPKMLELSKNRVDFESGVYMGMGSFNLLLSLLPARTLRLLEWVGFSGNKKNGLEWLDQGVHINGLRSPMCTITLLGYQVVAVPMLGIGDTDVPYVNEILKCQLDKFPDGSIFLYFSGRLKQSQGLINEALAEYEKAVSVSIDWHQVHHICYWEMMWCYSFLGQWESAAHYAEILSTESKWSKCSYVYMHAAFLMMQQFELRHSGDDDKVTDADAMSDHIDSLLGNVRKYKQRIAGKSIPFEKFSVTRVDKYNATGSLVLPGLEIIHLWNGFSMFNKDKKTLEHFLHLTSLALADLKETEGMVKEHHDNVCLCLLLKGICLRHLNRIDEAEEMLNSVAVSSLSSHSSKMDSYLPPYASAELAAMYADLGWKEKALEQYENTLKNYEKYGLESRLHFRLHSGIEVIKEAMSEKSKGNEDVSVESSNDDEFFDVEETFSITSEVDFDKKIYEKSNNIKDGAVHLDEPLAINEVKSKTSSNKINELDVKLNGLVNSDKADVNFKDVNHKINDVDNPIRNGPDVCTNVTVYANSNTATTVMAQRNNESVTASASFPNMSLSAETRKLSEGVFSSLSDKKDKKSRFSLRSLFHKPTISHPKQTASETAVSSVSLSEASSDISPVHVYKVQSTGQLVDRQTGL